MTSRYSVALGMVVGLLIVAGLVFFLSRFSSEEQGEVSSATSETTDALPSDATSAPVPPARGQQSASPASTPSAAPSGGAKVPVQIDPQLRKGLEAFFSAGPTTTPEEILAQCPQGHYTDTDWEGKPTVPHIFVMYQTPKFEVLDQYMFVEKKFVNGFTSVQTYKDKTSAQQFTAYAVQELSSRGVCTKMLQRPKADGSPPDMILDWKCGEAVFSIFLEAVKEHGFYLALLAKAETTEEPQHTPGELRGMEPLTDPAAALSAWGVSMPAGWNPGKGTQATGAQGVRKKPATPVNVDGHAWVKKPLPLKGKGDADLQRVLESSRLYQTADGNWEVMEEKTAGGFTLKSMSSAPVETETPTPEESKKSPTKQQGHAGVSTPTTPMPVPDFPALSPTNGKLPQEAQPLGKL